MSNIWARCMELLRTRVNEHTVSTWLEPIICEDISEDQVVLSVPNNFFIGWIKDNYVKMIRDSLLEVTGTRYEMNFKSRDDFGNKGFDTALEQQDQSVLSESMSMTDEFALKRNLNPRYTFESFVVGGCNQFAHAAALSVSENPGKSYNPLFIYGGTGLEKLIS